MTDAEGRYTFVDVKPGAYPWGNHDNAWRPAHIHFSLMGPAFAQRLVTQMYFPGDPLFASTRSSTRCATSARARADGRGVLDIDDTQPDWALAYRWDIVLRGPAPTPFEEAH